MDQKVYILLYKKQSYSI